MNGPEDDIDVDLDPPQDPANVPTDIPEKPEAKPADPPWQQLSETLERISNRPDPPPYAPPPAAPQQLDPAKLREINEKLAGDILVNPLGVIMPVAQQIANEQIAALRTEMQPYVDNAAAAFVDRFKSRMERSDGLYKNVVDRFEASIGDLNLRDLAGRSKAEQDKALTLHWNAAKGEVLAAKVRRPTPPAAPPGSSAGGGRGMSEPRGGTGGTLGETERQLLRWQLGKEAGEAAIREIEAQL